MRECVPEAVGGIKDLEITQTSPPEQRENHEKYSPLVSAPSEAPDKRYEAAEASLRQRSA